MTGNITVSKANRFQILLFFLFLWATLISGRLLYFSVFVKEESQQQMQELSLEKGRIRAMRGNLLSADGKLLAYTVRQSSIHLKTSIDSNQLNNLLEILENEMGFSRRKILMKLAHANNTETIVIAENIDNEMISRFSENFTNNPAVFIKMSFKRMYTVNDKRIGEVRLVDGQLEGISGYEKQYNQLLKGEDWIYEVMLDRRHQFIEKTFKEINPMKPGTDVHLTPQEWQ